MVMVVPNVVRYAVHQQLGGRAVVNIVDMDVRINGVGPSREDAVHDVAGDLLNNWTDHILAYQCQHISALSISWVDLDSVNGSVGSRNSTDDNTWPDNGGTSSPIPFPGMVAMRVIKNTTGGRQARKGRMYLAGFDEGKSGTQPNQWLPAVVSDMNTRLAGFLSGIEDAGALNVVERFPVVIHAPAGGTPNATRVTGYSVDPVMGTQRRRTRD